ncbi:MAG: hypothetical protein AAFY78_09390 [Cyanobacteria bacterium J06648_16]
MSAHPSTNEALAKMLRFIDTYQQQHPQQSSIQVARALRAYTRPVYADRFWELVAGNNPDFVAGELDNATVVMGGQLIDFAHFMASLSDQSWGGNVASTVSDGLLWLASKAVSGRGFDSREYTAAIGDTAQPIEVYLDKHGGQTYQPDVLADLLNRFASDQDYASDLLAYRVGRLLADAPRMPLAEAIQTADRLSYADAVAAYLTDAFGAQLAEQQIENIDGVKTRIYERIRAYLLIKRDALRASLLNRTYWRQVRPALMRQATDHFVAYLTRALAA